MHRCLVFRTIVKERLKVNACFRSWVRLLQFGMPTAASRSSMHSRHWSFCCEMVWLSLYEWRILKTHSLIWLRIPTLLLASYKKGDGPSLWDTAGNPFYILITMSAETILVVIVCNRSSISRQKKSSSDSIIYEALTLKPPWSSSISKE